MSCVPPLSARAHDDQHVLAQHVHESQGVHRDEIQTLVVGVHHHDELQILVVGVPDGMCGSPHVRPPGIHEDCAPL